MLTAVKRNFIGKFIYLSTYYLDPTIMQFKGTDYWPIDPHQARFRLEDVIEDQLIDSVNYVNTSKE